MLFAEDFGNWKKYESMKKDDYSVNEIFWKKYKGISKVLSKEIPADKLYEVTDNYVFWIVGNSYDEKMHENLWNCLKQSDIHICFIRMKRK